MDAFLNLRPVFTSRMRAKRCPGSTRGIGKVRYLSAPYVLFSPYDPGEQWKRQEQTKGSVSEMGHSRGRTEKSRRANYEKRWTYCEEGRRPARRVARSRARVA